MDTEQYTNKVGMDSLPNLVWSAYDRIHFREIGSFQQFFEPEEEITEWIGNIQSLHLYQYHSAAKIKVNKTKTNKGCYIIDPSEPEKKYAFGMIMSVKLDPLVFCTYCEDECNSAIIECIKQNIDSLSSKISYDIFFSLGEEDLVLILLGNSIDEFMIIVNMLRNISFTCDNNVKSVFVQTYSFVFQNSESYFKGILENKLSSACVYLSLNDNIYENEFCKKIEEEFNSIFGDCTGITPTLMIGEYDIKYTFPCKKIKKGFYELYSSEEGVKNLLNGKSEFYQKYIQKSKTIWCCDLRKLEKKKTLLPQPQNYDNKVIKSFNPDPDFCALENHINQTISMLNVKMKDCKDYLLFVYNNIVSFLKESKLVYHSITNKQWKYIVYSQIKAFLFTYEKYEALLELDKKFVKSFNELIENMKKALFHINRSKDLFYQLPTNSLQYSGSFNKVLLAYYGFINELIKHAFKKPHDISSGTKQSNIVFFVFFGMSPKINSHIYFNDSERPNEAKLVGFELPYPALYDFEKYFISLIHEVYHLIAPFNREKRNQRLTTLWKQAYIKHEFVRFATKQFDSFGIEISKDDITLNKHELLAAIQSDPNTAELVTKKLDNTVFVELVELYLTNSSIVFEGLMKSVKTSNYDTINSALKSYFEDDSIAGYYQQLFKDFLKYCRDYSEKHHRESNIAFLSELITVVTDYYENCKFDTLSTPEFQYDKNQLIRMNSIATCIKECICDTYAIQIAYPRDSNLQNKSLLMYVEYLIRFFKSNGVDITCIDATFRIILLFYCFSYKPSKKELASIMNKQDVETIYKMITSKKSTNLDLTEIRLIKELIISDDFVRTCRKYYSDIDYADIMENLKRIKEEFIFPVSQGTGFEDQINTIIHLNKTFVFAKNDENYYKTVSNKTPRKALTKEEQEVHYNHLKVYRIDCIEKYLSVVRTIKDSLKEPVWFRGICNIKYGLIPSLYVNLPAKDTIPYYYQIALLRQSYYQTRKYYNHLIDSEQPIVARQSLMQHYGVPTNLLDFSTDPLSALFWALNPESQRDKDNDSSGANIPTAVVYAFYPHQYKQAIQYINEKISTSGISIYQNHIYGFGTHNSLDDEYIIRDELDKKAKKRAQRYLNEIEIYHDTGDESLLYSKSPIPLVVPQKNIRINAQEGTFVAFNFFSIPKQNIGAEDPPSSQFSYLSLANLQEKYAQICEQNGDSITNLFLERIEIDRYSKMLINDNLKTIFDYSLEKAYPDFPKLISDVKEHTYGYKKLEKKD